MGDRVFKRWPYDFMKLLQLVLSMGVTFSLFPLGDNRNSTASIIGIVVGHFFIFSSMITWPISICMKKSLALKIEIHLLASLAAAWIIMYIISVKQFNDTFVSSGIGIVLHSNNEITWKSLGEKLPESQEEKLPESEVVYARVIPLESIEALQTVDFVNEKGISIVNILLVYQICFVIYMFEDYLPTCKTNEPSTSAPRPDDAEGIQLLEMPERGDPDVSVLIESNSEDNLNRESELAVNNEPGVERGFARSLPSEGQNSPVNTRASRYGSRGSPAACSSERHPLAESDSLQSHTQTSSTLTLRGSPSSRSLEESPPPPYSIHESRGARDFRENLATGDSPNIATAGARPNMFFDPGAQICIGPGSQSRASASVSPNFLWFPPEDSDIIYRMGGGFEYGIKRKDRAEGEANSSDQVYDLREEPETSQAPRKILTPKKILTQAKEQTPQRDRDPTPQRDRDPTPQRDRDPTPQRDRDPTPKRN